MVYVDKDELYPFYFLSGQYGETVDLSEDQIALVNEGMSGFDRAQAILEAAYQRAR